jgi:penicillin-binding protein 2
MKLNFDKNKDPFTVKEKKYGFGSLKDSFYHLGWMENSFLVGDGDKDVLKKTFDSSKLKIVFFVLFLVFFLFLARLFWLQIIEGDRYGLLAEGNRVRVSSIEPNRGIIYSSDLTPLLRNEANFLLYLTPIDLPRDERERDKLIRDLANILSGEKLVFSEEDDVSDIEMIGDSFYFAEIKKKLENVEYKSLESYQPLFIMDNIDYESAISLQLKTERMPGVSLSFRMRRKYFDSEENLSSLSHLIGYTGKISEKDLEVFGDEYSLIDYIGKSGLEYFYENELKGEKGQKYIEVDSLGREKKIISEIPAKDGNSLLLSLDLDLQKKSEEILKDYLLRYNKERASIVILDPRTGAVLTLISWPSYDNNIFSRGISQADYSSLINNPHRPLFNRAISGSFPSGSSIKPVVAAAALEEGIITGRTSLYSGGGISVGPWFFPDWKAGGHGPTNVRKAIAESVNTFFYLIAGGYENFEGLGIDSLIEYFKLFGLGQQSGIDLPQESRGFVPSPEWKKETIGENWYIGNTYHVSIGQGDISSTPLQIANITSFFANGGKLYRPYLVEKVLSKDDEILRSTEKDIIREGFISDANVQIIKEGMRETIVSGSARRLNYLPIKIAGKTGTAQWRSNRDPHSWFTSFAPYEHPEIVLTVLVEEGGDGSDMASSIAGDILEWYFTKEDDSSDLYE